MEIGQKVKVIGNNSFYCGGLVRHYLTIGEEGIITELHDKYSDVIRVEQDSLNQWVNIQDVELIETTLTRPADSEGV
jgi:hypothetical protein